MFRKANGRFFRSRQGIPCLDGELAAASWAKKHPPSVAARGSFRRVFENVVDPVCIAWFARRFEKFAKHTPLICDLEVSDDVASDQRGGALSDDVPSGSITFRSGHVAIDAIEIHRRVAVKKYEFSSICTSNATVRLPKILVFKIISITVALVISLVDIYNG